MNVNNVELLLIALSTFLVEYNNQKSIWKTLYPPLLNCPDD